MADLEVCPTLGDHVAAFAQAAVLILLAAAAGTRIVAADARAAVADRLRLGFNVGTGVRLLLAALKLLRRAGRFSQPVRRLHGHGGNGHLVPRNVPRRFISGGLRSVLHDAGPQLHDFVLGADHELVRIGAFAYRRHYGELWLYFSDDDHESWESDGGQRNFRDSRRRGQRNRAAPLRLVPGTGRQ